MENYDKGDVVRVSGAFTDANGNPQDPTGVLFKYQDPSLNETTLTHGVDAALVKDDTGDYHVDITTDESGVWHWRWDGTGTGAAAAEGAFYVAVSEF